MLNLKQQHVTGFDDRGERTHLNTTQVACKNDYQMRTLPPLLPPLPLIQFAIHSIICLQFSTRWPPDKATRQSKREKTAATRKHQNQRKTMKIINKNRSEQRLQWQQRAMADSSPQNLCSLKMNLSLSLLANRDYLFFRCRSIPIRCTPCTPCDNECRAQVSHWS